ncbi:response regulator [Photobacterium minamisatsumaniensis]|uniref:response regulator n=1 Tax=Photobacterium minamisatsumaniensis TaxID=2910233 RepID=UPI003D0CFACD
MISDKKFLLIDDSSTAISIMRSILNTSGVSNEKIDSTMDSLKAIRLLTQHKYDIVLCDYNMGHHIDGGLIFDEVKQRKLLANDGVFICVTGDNTRQVVTHFIELEPDDYLIKPFSTAVFIERIKSVLKRKSALYSLLLAVDNKEYDIAIEHCIQFHALYPQYRAYIDRIHGDCLLRANRHNEAKLFYAEACKNYEHIWPQIGLGQALQGLGELKSAEATFQNILAKHPKQPLARKYLASCMMTTNRIPEALAQFELLHQVNSANPLRELIIANLYATLQCHKEAAICYQRFTNKVIGTSRFSYGVNVNTSVSLMLASIYADERKVAEELLNEASHSLHDQHSHKELDQANYEREISTMISLAILACIHGEIEDCFTIVSKINLDERPSNDFYTVLNVARIYGFCGMPMQYEHTMQIAKKLCAASDDDVLVQSQIKLLEACHTEVNTRLKTGGELVERAFCMRENNKAKDAIKDAYRAFHMVPYHYKLCFLILELTALATPSFLKPAEVKCVITSCHWVIIHDTRPSKEDMKRADDLYTVALTRIRMQK